MKLDIKLHAKINNEKFRYYVISENHTPFKHTSKLIVDGVEIVEYNYGLFYKIKSFFNKKTIC